MQAVETILLEDQIAEITKRCAGLKLSWKEAEIEITVPLTEDGLVLIGKFCTKRHVSLESVARVLKSVWKAENSFEVSDLGENKAMFLFQTKDDMERVLLLSPWSFDKYLLILHKMLRGEAVIDIKFDKTPFWIQIHGLPTMCQNQGRGTEHRCYTGEGGESGCEHERFLLGELLAR